MTKGKKRGFDKKAAHLRAAAAAVAAASTVAYPRKTRNKSSNEQPGNRDWNTMGPESREQGTGTGMLELARNTRNKASHWDQGSKLRDRPVAFVSGGYIEPADELDSEPPAPAETSGTMPPVATETETHNMQTSPRHGVNSKTPPFLQGPSDSDSDSSTEVILFKGRNSHVPAQPDKLGEYDSRTAETATGQQRHGDNIPDGRDMSSTSVCLDHLLAASDGESESAAAIDDYIANLLLNDTDDAAEEVQERHTERVDGKSKFVPNADECFDKGAKETAYHGTGRSACSSDDDEGEDAWLDSRGDSDDISEKTKMATDIDDEQLARLLSKQEELGFDTSELILLDGDSINPPNARSRDGQSDNRPKKSKMPGLRKATVPVCNLKKLKPRDGSYPSAEAVADAFELLEVTGWSNHHDRLELGLSDSELEAALLASWQKDSRRKKDRKKAREELRSQGLLGKKSNANDARLKYPNGMSLEEIRAEFRGFLLGAEQSVILPPMDAHARKIIHELAHRFGITSKSTGTGNQRRPTLVRKKGTLKYDESHFNNVFSRVGRRYFSRLDAKQVGAGGMQKPRGSSNAAVVVRNGEIVGGSAPEIGQENKGRTMLEKMGWSVGMALGAVDNKGMTQPIEHVVKRSKAGLG